MPTIRLVQRTKISIIWKITSHNLKKLKHKYLENIDEYNRFSWVIINFFREKEKAIKENRQIKIDRLSYMKELEQKIKSIE